MEVIPLAAARNASNPTTTPKNGRGASRLSFAKISDTLTVPDLLALQTESFDWLVGNEAWRTRVAEATKAGRRDIATASGLKDLDRSVGYSQPAQVFQSATDAMNHLQRREETYVAAHEER